MESLKSENNSLINNVERPIVTISEGQIQGVSSKSLLGHNYLAFKGIPFAQPPIGSLRFKEPQPPLKWSGIRDASKSVGGFSTQQGRSTHSEMIIGSEDCLYLNVHTKNIGRKRPVMFYIHGGAYVKNSGSDNVYSQDYFTMADIVLVTTNYRLGPLGFLNLGHEVASGNQGLRDIILALKWVQKNIEAFAGDPSNVTIFGNSAGSIICHLFTYLPVAKGLFHKAILQSGYCYWHKHLLKGDDSFKNGFKIAELLGFDSTDPMEVVEYLRSVPARKLVELEGRILSKWEKTVNFAMEYCPVFDGNYTENPVVPLPLTKLLKNDADIPIIIGHTIHEFLFSLKGHFDNEEFFKMHNDNIEELIKNEIVKPIEPSKLLEIIKDLCTHYLKNKPIQIETAWNLINLMTDIRVINHNRKIVGNRNSCGAQTYVYCFSYLGKEMTNNQYGNSPQALKGVTHADELAYMFYLAFMKRTEGYVPLEDTTDRLVMERFIKMWTNFAATGNPTPETDGKLISTIWKPTTKDNEFYLDINAELTLKDDKNHANRPMYEKLEQYYPTAEIE